MTSRLQPQGQQLPLPRPVTVLPLHLCPSLSILQTGCTFQSESWNSRHASGQARAARSPCKAMGGLERGLIALPSGLGTGELGVL